MCKPPQIGKMIRDELRRQGRSVVWLSNRLHINRSTCYHIFQGQSIDTMLLLQIAQLLQVDFFAAYSEILKHKDMPEKRPNNKPINQ